MSEITLELKRLQGVITPPPDKSISHRAIIIGSLAEGETQVKNLSVCEDCLRTMDAFKTMGVSISRSKGLVRIQGEGLNGLRRPRDELYLGNSATSMRLILGVLAGQKFSCKLLGDASLSQRPMKRVILPLSSMGAKIRGRKRNGQEYAPLTIQGGKLKAIHYGTPVASAQVKSAILLAGLYAEGETQVREPAKSRDHTERMLKRFGADISQDALAASVQGRANLISRDVDVPGDISAASFFLVGACIGKGSQVSIQSVGLNPTRSAFLNILQKMGADLCWNCQNNQVTDDDYDEPRGEITARYSQLQAVTIAPQQISSLIDELPILMVAATQAEGETTIQGAGELRVKETDRINAMVSNLSRMGADITSTNNDIIIRGPSRLRAAHHIDSFNDHRTAMSMAIAGLVTGGRITIRNADCVDVSFPGFFETLAQVSRS